MSDGDQKSEVRSQKPRYRVKAWRVRHILWPTGLFTDPLDKWWWFREERSAKTELYPASLPVKVA